MRGKVVIPRVTVSLGEMTAPMFSFITPILQVKATEH